MNRRSFLVTTAGATGALLANHHEEAKAISHGAFYLAVKDGMIGQGNSLTEKYQLLKDLGYDGVEGHAPMGSNPAETLAASKATGLPVHGVVNSIHWNTKLSAPDEEERAKALQGLLTCIEQSYAIGGSSVLLVPGVVGKGATAREAWDRSLVGIQKALPLASKLGIHILIENVWNGMFYDPAGPNTQSADLLKNYLDEINSPWVGSYFDIGNHQRFGKPAEWIKTLGRRIVKLDVKDWGIKAGFCKIGEGDVDWPEVRAALKDIGYQGWATAEVGGGNKDRLDEVLQNMRTHLVGA
ncbi:MAG: sugar phosphate isomerase/epimerase family protein [Akkermansiaceae bacterium]|jgi:L-ribulose-5-phosphate 3-epimerase